MFHKHIQKNKNEKILKKIFFFVFFECVCDSRTSWVKDLMDHESLFPQALSGAMKYKHIQKKQKQKKF
jgi:hypothetical protein